MALLPRLFIAGILFIHIAYSAESEARPRIGLVLSGGGARGAAHIGVIELLEELRVPIDCVTGTSMGALVAGVYAAGQSPKEMRDSLARADWDDMFQDKPSYPEINLRTKEISRRLIPGLEIGVSKPESSLGAGLIAGQKIKLFFHHLVGSDTTEQRIETLPIPLSIIATNIGTGERVVFRDGDLPTAMRASMSVPGLMSPVSYQGNLLVDGGLVDNLPIAEAHERCRPDKIIAVNVGTPLMPAEKVGSLVTVTIQMVSLLTEQNVAQSLKLLKPSDIYIQPDLTGISAADFAKNKETADRGRQAAEAFRKELAALSVSKAEFSRWQASRSRTRSAPPKIDAIEIATDGTPNVNPAALQRHLTLQAGETMNPEALDRSLLRAYGDGWYENVDYALQTQQERRILKITPIEKRWGPDYLRFGINLDTNFYRDSGYTLRVAYDKTWLNTLGGQMLLVGEIGQTNALGLNFYQPLDPKQRFFAETNLKAATNTLGLYEEGSKFGEYHRRMREISLGAGINIGVMGQLSTGWQRRWIEASAPTGLPNANENLDITNARVNYNGQYLRLDFDQLDRLHFPSAGWAAKLHYFKPDDENYSRLLAEFSAAAPFRDIVIGTRLSYQGSPKGRLPAYDAFSLGGFMNLSGLTHHQIYGDDIKYAHVRLEHIIGRLPIIQSDMRLGVAFETATIGNLYTETHRTGRQNAVSTYLGGETPIGPVYFGYGQTQSGDKSLYLFIGIP